MLSLEQKIGQLIIIGILGTEPQHEFVKQIEPQIRAGQIGGIIHFDRNVQSPSQLKSLNQYLQSLSPHKLFIAVDQEGGRVQRLSSKNGFPDYPSAKVLGAQGAEKVRESSEDMAAQLQDVGFNLNFAPSVDLDLGCSVISGLERSYGKEVATVVACAESFMQGHQKYGVLCVIKHFPGHGSATGDTHEQMVDVTDAYQDVELKPFKDLIQKQAVKAIMTSHIFHRKWDASMPMTMSSEALQKLRHLGFQGVIISDDMHMGAIQKKFRKKGYEDNRLAQGFDLKEAVVRAFQAGIDIFIFSNHHLAAQGIENFQADPQIVPKIIEAVKEAIGEGRLTEAQIDEKWKRMLTFRQNISK